MTKNCPAGPLNSMVEQVEGHFSFHYYWVSRATVSPGPPSENGGCRAARMSPIGQMGNRDSRVSPIGQMGNSRFRIEEHRSKGRGLEGTGFKRLQRRVLFYQTPSTLRAGVVPARPLPVAPWGNPTLTQPQPSPGMPPSLSGPLRAGVSSSLGSDQVSGSQASQGTPGGGGGGSHTQSFGLCDPELSVGDAGDPEGTQTGLATGPPSVRAPAQPQL